MKQTIKQIIGKGPLQLWSKLQFADYVDPKLRIDDVQNHVLSRILTTIRGSTLSRVFHLDGCRNLEQFRRSVPLLGYDEFAPYIERVMGGETTAMYAPQIRVIMFAVSSGTTGPRKFIPINHKAVAELKRTWRLWGTHLYTDHPDLMDCPITQITSDGMSGKTKGGIPFGDLSGFLAEIQPWYVSRYYAVPSIINKIADETLKYYVFLRFALANRDLRILTTASPATLLRIAQMSSQYLPQLIKDFREGGISLQSDGRLPKDIQVRLAASDRSTSSLLEAVANAGNVSPKNFWPHLKVLACWTGGTMGHFKPVLRDAFGPAVFRDLGLASSEAHVTIPFADDRDDGLLNLFGNVYEFIDDAQNVYWAHELEEGQSYNLVITTLNGLLRYHTYDRVVCTGHMGKWPLLRFENKGDYICDLTGEKLTAYHVSKAVESVVESTGLKFGPFVVAPRGANDFPRGYRLLVEDGFIDRDVLISQVMPMLDSALGTANFIYQEHRSAYKLAPLALETVPMGRISQWNNQRLRDSGGSLEQYKPPCLITDPDRYLLKVS